MKNSGASYRVTQLGVPHPTHRLVPRSKRSKSDPVCKYCGTINKASNTWPTREGIENPCPNYFHVGQVKALCGGKFPHAEGFTWDRVEYFLLENGTLEPYAGDEILPGPGIAITAKEDVGMFFGRLFTGKGSDAPHPELPFIKRQAVTALVRNPENGKFLCLRWKDNVDWETFVTGGIEKGETPEDAARKEVLQETGYKNLRLFGELPPYQAKFYHAQKKENRHAQFTSFLFDLINDDRDPIAEDESSKHEAVWLDENELSDFRLPDGQRFLLESVDFVFKV